MLFLGISIETQQTRAVVFSLESNAILSEGVAPHLAGNGFGFSDPSEWVRTVNESVHQCLGKIDHQRKRLAGISVAGPAQGMVFLDEENRLLEPTKKMEASAKTRAAQTLGRRFGGRPGVLELLGRPLERHSTAACLSWLKQEDPAVLGRVATILQPHEFINFWLTGVKRGDWSGGSETGLMNVVQREWCPEVITEIDARVGACLPELHSSDEVAGGLRPEIAHAWGVSDHLLVAAGGSRAAMEAMGAGTINPGEVMVSFSNEGALRVLIEKPIVDPLGELVLGCDGTGQWMLSAGQCRSGALVEEVKAQWGWDNGQFEQVAAAVAPGAGGLHYLSRGGQSVLQGLRAGNLTSSNLARAAMESAAFEMKRALARAGELGVKPTRIRLVGGSGEAVGWRQVLADVLGAAVASGSVYSSPAVGAALQAAVAFYHSTGENLTYTEVAEYALPISDEDWSYPSEDLQQGYRELAEHHGLLEEALQREGAVSGA